MAKILLVAGHGQGDPGANGGGYNERDTMRQLVDRIKKLIPNEVDVYDKSLDMFQQTRAGGGMYTTKYRNIIEFHMDAAGSSATGGHVIIYKGYKPDTLDNRLANTIKQRVGWIRPNGFDGRNNLLNLNVAAQRGISYRLLELGFITNANDRKKIISEMNETAKVIAEAITNKSVSNKPSKPAKPNKPSKTIEQLANEVIAGKHGSGEARKKSLGKQYNAVQKRVNEKLGVKPNKLQKKSIDAIAREVIRGDWGNGQSRYNRLKKAGYNPDAVQRRVNQLM